jgi:hypothetical protein
MVLLDKPRPVRCKGPVFGGGRVSTSAPLAAKARLIARCTGPRPLDGARGRLRRLGWRGQRNVRAEAGARAPRQPRAGWLLLAEQMEWLDVRKPPLHSEKIILKQSRIGRPC